jgi:hypothetical protein
MKKCIYLISSLFIVLTVTACANEGNSGSNKIVEAETTPSSTPVEQKPLTPYESFYELRPSLVFEVSNLYLYQLDLSDDSIREKRSAEVKADENLNRISVVLDLAINRGLFDDIYGANSSVNTPQLFCDSVRDEAIGSILGIFRKGLDSSTEPMQGFEISVLRNVYDKFEDNFGGFEYKLVKKYGKDKVGISVNNWKKIIFDNISTLKPSRLV